MSLIRTSNIKSLAEEELNVLILVSINGPAASLPAKGVKKVLGNHKLFNPKLYH